MKRKTQSIATLLTAASVSLTAIACGSWAGNPKSDKDTQSEGSKDDPNNSLDPESQSAILAPGEMAIQKVQLAAGESLNAKFKLKKSSTALNLAESEAAMQEVSVLGPDEREISFARAKKDDLEVPVAAQTDGTYYVTIRNNSAEAVTIDDLTEPEAEQDEESIGDLKKTNEADAAFKDYSFKATLFFSKYCTTENSKYMTPARNVNETLTSYVKTIKAPDGEYFAQTIAFLGKIKSDKTVERISTAKISLKVGDKEQVLLPLESLATDTIGTSASGAPANSGSEAFAAVRAEYAGFLGAAGELYTTETFRKLGNCDTAQTFTLSQDPGKDKVEINIVDGSTVPALSKKVLAKVTVGSALQTYKTASTKQTTWDTCSYNINTAEPYNSSKGSGSCEAISISKPPSAKIDQLASEIYPGIVTKASDPTRALFYGRSLSRAFLKALVDNAQNNETSASPSVGIQGCLYNGGLVSTPASKEQSFLPVEEFQFKVGDIFSLGSRLGSYTAMTDFYQGNVLENTELKLARNLPVAGGLAVWKTILAKWQGCTRRADSGVFAAAIGDYGIYPGDEGMYGVIAE